MRFYDFALIGVLLWSNTVLTKVQSDDEADDTKKKTHQADIGVLRIRSTIDLSSQQAPLPFLCGEAVNCVNGLKQGTSTTCASACAGRCCVGDNACGHFTGKLCLGGGSPLCSGKLACWDANIPFIGGNGSCTGDRACQWANLEGSNSAWSIVSSCKGKSACEDIATIEDPGTIGNLTNSCIGTDSCARAAGWGGSVGGIINSCHGYSACYSVGYHFGSVGDIVDSCHGDASCQNAAEYYGRLGDLKKSCNAYAACYMLGGASGLNHGVGDVTNSCNASKACMYAGAGVCWQCWPDDCSTNDYGGIGNLITSCSASKSCYLAGAAPAYKAVTGNWPHTILYGSGIITSDVNKCCNSAEQCMIANETTLPGACKAVPTVAPTKKQPSSMPTSMKPSTLKPSSLKPSTLKPLTLKPLTLKPSTLKPSTLTPSTKTPTLKPLTLKPSTRTPTLKPSTLKPSTLKPSTLKPLTSKPTQLPFPKHATIHPTQKPASSKPTQKL